MWFFKLGENYIVSGCKINNVSLSFIFTSLYVWYKHNPLNDDIEDINLYWKFIFCYFRFYYYLFLLRLNDILIRIFFRLLIQLMDIFSSYHKMFLNLLLFSLIKGLSTFFLDFFLLYKIIFTFIEPLKEFYFFYEFYYLGWGIVFFFWYLNITIWRIECFYFNWICWIHIFF